MFRDGGSRAQIETNEAVVYPVLQAKDLFKRSGYVDAIEAIKKKVELKEDPFSQLYQPLLEGYAQFVQHLVTPRDKRDMHMMTRSLRRAYGLLVSSAKDVRIAATSKGRSFDPDRLIYAMFSAAMLHGIGRICQDRRVVLCDDKGYYLKNWSPHAGSMGDGFYKVRSVVSQPEALVEALHILYAKVIMPDVGLSWLLEDPSLYLMWVQALSDFNGGFSDLDIGFDLDGLERIVEQEIDLQHDDVSFIPEETLAGEQFWAWLKERLKQDSSLINQDGSGLHHVSEGLLLEAENVFSEFCKTNASSYRDWTIIAGQFNHLGLTRLSGAGLQYEQYVGVGGTLGSIFSAKSSQSKKASIEKGMLIEHEQRYTDFKGLGPAAQLQSQTPMSSSERLCARIGGLAYQFMLGHTPHGDK